MDTFWKDLSEQYSDDYPLDHIKKTLRGIETIYQPLPGDSEGIKNRSNEDMRRYRSSVHLDCDMVDENVYLGSAYTAKDKDYLKKLGITDVLNVALGSGPDFAETPDGHYLDTEISYLAIEISNHVDEDLSLLFPRIIKFINNAISAGGKVLIHGKSGLTTSAAFTIAWLIEKRHLTVLESIEIVKKLRPIQLNDSFILQLCIFGDNLQNRRDLDQADARSETSTLSSDW